MKYILNPIHQLLQRLQGRFNRARPGSVMILVVGLLVVLAIMATAMISASRNDRYATQQNVANTQIDLLLDGLQNLTENAITSDLFDTTVTPNKFKAISDSDTTQEYVNTDAATDAYKPWLAQRSPVLVATGGTNRPGWAAFSWPLQRNGGLIQFDFPNSPTPLTIAPPPARSGGVAVPAVNDKKNFVAVIDSSSTMLSNGQSVPALTLYDVPSGAATSAPLHTAGATPPKDSNGNNIVGAKMAADADGDGIADSFFWKLPIGQINGVTFYAAVRIIDNNSAINLNTARARDVEYAGNEFGAGAGSLPNYGVFPSNIGLRELFSDYTTTAGGQYSAQMDYAPPTPASPVPPYPGLNYTRFNNAKLSPAVSNSAVKLDSYAEITPYAKRVDFTYVNQGEAAYAGIARRLRNPGGMGVDTVTPGGPFPIPYTPLDTGDTSLQYRFCLINPWATKSTGSETILADSVYNFATSQNRPFAPSDYYYWFDKNFNFDGNTAGGNMNGSVGPANPNTSRAIRAILVNANPLSILTPFHSQAALAIDNPAGVRGQRDVSVVPLAAADANLMPNYSGGTAAATKISINTATFGERWFGFWNVMADHFVADNPATTGTDESDFSTPFFNPGTPAGGIYQGMKFHDPIAAAGVPPTLVGQFNAAGHGGVAPDDDAVHPAFMFRNPLRSTTAGGLATTYFDPKNTMLLRAAIAAANAKELISDPAANVASRDIYLKATVAGAANTPVTVTVYGTKPQPFITEIYANNDDFSVDGSLRTNTRGYVAIELHNPYPTAAINLAGWRFRVISRTPGAAVSDPTIVIPLTGSIPASGFIVFDNFAPATGGAADDAHVRSGVMGVTVPNYAPLQQVMPVVFAAGLPSNYELVLERPAAAGALGGAFAPVDSFDFTGFPSPTTDAGGNRNVTGWHYARETANWKFVYPGRYNGGIAARRHQGIMTEQYIIPPGNADPMQETWVSTPPPAAGGGTTPTPFSFGAANIEASYPNTFSIQFANTGFTTANTSTFGRFARLGDLLQITYFGSYVVSTAGGALVDLNGTTMDCAFAEDTSLLNDSAEQIGRFCPTRGAVAQWDSTKAYVAGDMVMRNNILYVAPTGAPVNTNPTAGDPPWKPIPVAEDAYTWATDVFDYFTTTQNPNKDFMPNISPGDYGAATAVKNSSATATANTYTEDSEPVEGLININTAPWYVIAQLPLFPSGVPTAGAIGADGYPVAIEQMAKSIVYFRDVDDGSVAGSLHPHGPFQNLFELNLVPSKITSPTVNGGFQDAFNHTGLATRAATAAWGDITNPTTGVANDFEYRYLMINRISNLVTLRSDSFTAYMLIQGYRGAGTPNAELVVQRRRAEIINRYPVVSNGTRTITPIPVQSD